MISIKDYYPLEQVVPESMALVDFVVDKYIEQQPLKNTTALFFQHQLANQVTMVKALIKLGLSPDRIKWIDIPYTSNFKTREELIELKLKDFVISDNYSLLMPYASYQKNRAINAYKDILESNYEHLLVLDDGAYFLEAASYFKSRPARCVIVEQTSRGIKKLEKNKAMKHVLKDIPLIDVARTPLKKELESPFIGMSVCAALDHHITPYLKKSKNKLRCLVLGYGNIGQAVVNFLRSVEGVANDHIYIYDTDKKKTKDVPTNRKWNHSCEETFDLVVGCSGNTSFDFGDYVLLNDNAILVSASSGAIEFNRRNILEQAQLNDLDDVWLDKSKIDHNLHNHIPIHFPGRTVTLLNGGCPINFDGRMTVSKSSHIQVTMALMVEAAVQSTKLAKGACDIQKLDDTHFVELAELFYKDNTEDLDVLPDFSKLLKELKGAE